MIALLETGQEDAVLALLQPTLGTGVHGVNSIVDTPRGRSLLHSAVQRKMLSVVKALGDTPGIDLTLKACARARRCAPACDRSPGDVGVRWHGYILRPAGQSKVFGNDGVFERCQRGSETKKQCEPTKDLPNSVGGSFQYR